MIASSASTAEREREGEGEGEGEREEGGEVENGQVNEKERESGQKGSIHKHYKSAIVTKAEYIL